MLHRGAGFWYRMSATVTRPPLALLLRRDWHGREHLPRTGGFITVVNHNSYLDPVACGHFHYSAGRVPRFLAKSGLFTKGFVGTVLRGMGHIPVHRESRDVRGALRAAVEAVERGECVVFYPEGTLTRDPDLWPMAAKTGAARVALETRCPVVPLAQWGANHVLPPYAKKLSLRPRKTHHAVAGPPLDLSAYYGRAVTSELLAEVTAVMMTAITGQLAAIRGESAPSVAYGSGGGTARQPAGIAVEDTRPRTGV